jgi:hypothetical protein
MCQHLTIEEMIRLHRNPPPGGVRPTEQDLMEKLFTVVVRDNLIARAIGWYHGRYRRQLERVSHADIVDRLMEKLVMNPWYTPTPDGFTSYAINNLANLGSELAREDNRERRAVLTRATGAATQPQRGAMRSAPLERAMLKHGNEIIPKALIATTAANLTKRGRRNSDREQVFFAAAVIAGILPHLRSFNGLDFVPLGKVGLRQLVDHADMPAGATNRLWDAISHWKRRKTRKKHSRRRGFQTLLAECCGLSISTVSRSLASSSVRLAEPYKTAVARVVAAVSRERTGSLSDDLT